MSPAFCRAGSAFDSCQAAGQFAQITRLKISFPEEPRPFLSQPRTTAVDLRDCNLSRSKPGIFCCIGCTSEYLERPIGLPDMNEKSRSRSEDVAIPGG